LTITDSNGQEIREGDRVRLIAPPPMPEPSPLDDGKVVRVTEGGIEVEWPEPSDPTLTCLDFYFTDGRACPDLRVIDTTKEGSDR
jgi:hypothetical protein